MSTKIMITYKRKHGASHSREADGAVTEPCAASSSVGVVTTSEAPEYGVDADANMLNKDNSSTSTKQEDACKSVQQSVKEETAKPCVHASEKEQNEFQSCESLPRTEQLEISHATSPSVTEACRNKLHCTNDSDNPTPASSSMCDLRHADGKTKQAEDCNNSGPAVINSHQGPNDTTSPSQFKSRFSPLLTFHRRVKKKINLDEPAEDNYSRDNGKQCSTVTCSSPSSSLDAAPLLKETGGTYLGTENKVTTAGTSRGLAVPAKQLLEQKSSHIVKSTVQHAVPPHPAEDVNQGLTLECDDTPVSEYTSAREISESDAKVEDSSKTLAGVIEALEVVEVKEGHDDHLESEGSTKNIPIVVLDGDSGERDKEQENSKVLDQVVQEKNKSQFSLGQINLNCALLPQEKILDLEGSSVQRLPYQDHFGTEQKQLSQPTERLFLTKEKDTIHGKQQQLQLQEGTSTVHTMYSNFFDLTPSWNAKSFKEPRSTPSELKFRVMDKVPESSLDLSLDSFPDPSVSDLRHDKWFCGGSFNGSYLRTERLGTYSYKRRTVPWSEEELDFLWIGVRRYGTNNWNTMLRDTRLRFSNSRMAEDLAKQWNKEQKKLLGVDFLQPIRASALGPTPPSHVDEDHARSSSCSKCSKSPFLAAQTDLSLGDVYLRNSRASERGHHLSSLGTFNLHGIDIGRRNLSLGSFPVASTSYGKSGSRRRKTSKYHKSCYDNTPHWCQEPSERVSQLLPTNQQAINSLHQWLTKDVETGTSRPVPEVWPNMKAPVAEPPNDNSSLRAAFLQFPDDTMPHVLSDASLKRTLKRTAEWHSLSKKLFRTGDALDLNQRAVAMAAPNGTTTSDTGASSEETVSDS